VIDILPHAKNVGTADHFVDRAETKFRHRFTQILSKQVKEVYADLATQTDVALAKLKTVINTDVQQLNQLIREKSLPVIGVKKD